MVWFTFMSVGSVMKKIQVAIMVHYINMCYTNTYIIYLLTRRTISWEFHSLSVHLLLVCHEIMWNVIKWCWTVEELSWLSHGWKQVKRSLGNNLTPIWSCVEKEEQQLEFRKDKTENHHSPSGSLCSVVFSVVGFRCRQTSWVWLKSSVLFLRQATVTFTLVILLENKEHAVSHQIQFSQTV